MFADVLYMLDRVQEFVYNLHEKVVNINNICENFHNKLKPLETLS